MPISRRPTAISSPVKTGLGGGSKVSIPDTRLITVPAVIGTNLASPDNRAEVVLSADKLTFSIINVADNYYRTAIGNTPIQISSIPTGGYYVEFYINTTDCMIGLTNTPSAHKQNDYPFLGQRSGTGFSYYSGGRYYPNVNGAVLNAVTYTKGDYIGIMVNKTTISFFKNGVATPNLSYSDAGISDNFYFGASIGAPASNPLPTTANPGQVTINAGLTPFKYLPAGAVGLATPAYDLAAKTKQFDKVVKSVADINPRPKISEVFSADLLITRTNGRITNGLNLLYRDGAVWEKIVSQNTNNWFFSTTVRPNKTFTNNVANAEGSGNSGSSSITPYFIDGFTTNTYGNISPSHKQISYGFANHPYFFNSKTWVGTGVNERIIKSDLKIEIGMIIIRPITNPNYNITVWNRGSPLNQFYFNATNQKISTTTFKTTADSFTVDTNSSATNVSNETHVAFILGHDPSPDGLILCGTFISQASGAATINHGWAEGAQFVIYKAVNSSSDWVVLDIARTGTFSGIVPVLSSNNNGGESYSGGYANGVSDVGGIFTINNTGFGNSEHIYCIIRAPAKTTAPVIASFTQSSTVTGTNFVSATVENMSTGIASVIAATQGINPSFIQANFTTSTLVKTVVLGAVVTSLSGGNNFGANNLNGMSLQVSNNSGVSWTELWVIQGSVTSPASSQLYRQAIPINRACTNIRIYSNTTTSIAISQFTVT